ncbi:hypothetical protein [Proteiniphilum sp.]
MGSLYYVAPLTSNGLLLGVRAGNSCGLSRRERQTRLTPNPCWQ